MSLPEYVDSAQLVGLLSLDVDLYPTSMNY